MKSFEILLGLCVLVVLHSPPAHANQLAQAAPPALQKLTPVQLRDDFDQAIRFVDAFSVHKDLNALRLGIDYPRQFAELRRQIDDGTDTCGFTRLLTRALNLVQDPHVNTMSHEYLRENGKYQSRFNIAEDDTYSGVAAIEHACPAPKPTLDLPLMFIDGQYVVYADFNHKGVQVKRGTTLTSYNDQDIATYIRGHFDSVWPVRVNPAGALYSLRFHRGGEPTFRLGLSDGRVLDMDNRDQVDLVVPQTHKITYFSQKEARVLHFPEQHILYIGIPSMDESLVETINAQVDKVVRDGGKIDKIAIDIRGNGGGSDLTWRRVLSHLVGREMHFALDLRMKDSTQAHARYPQETATATKPVELLGGANYWVHLADVISFGPDADSLDFTGPIYVLRDAYIYSSAANFSNFASLDPQLVSVGETTDLVGGAQMEPLFFKLANSGLVFRIEPALDFSDVHSLEDFAHNNVEVEIQPTVEDQFIRSTYAEDIYGKDFLLLYDPLFRYVVDAHPDGHKLLRNDVSAGRSSYGPNRVFP